MKCSDDDKSNDKKDKKDNEESRRKLKCNINNNNNNRREEPNLISDIDIKRYHSDCELVTEICRNSATLLLASSIWNQEWVCNYDRAHTCTCREYSKQSGWGCACLWPGFHM